jgi:hypothetical protein
MACLLAVGFGSFLSASPAHAADPQLCFGSACLNAWGGGPYVNVYTGSRSVANDQFTVVSTGRYVGLQFLGGGGFNLDCIGDLNDSSTDARAGLYSDCAEAGGVAWGANFTESTASCGANEIAFKNVHWGGWLGPAGLANGDAFYLNKPTAYCFYVYGP